MLTDTVASTFGMIAVGDPRFVDRLRAGLWPSYSKVNRAFDHMIDHLHEMTGMLEMANSPWPDCLPGWDDPAFSNWMST